MTGGPLSSVKILEVGGIGPNPFAAMLLADMGADVLRVDRPGGSSPFAGQGADPVGRGRPTLSLDIKTDEGREMVMRLAESADALIEGFRPGVMERLGLGPDELLARNPRLVYGRMTGYGQEGPMASVAGHDINYISLAGVLGLIARDGERPLFPLNLVGDYGGGAMFLAFGVVCGVLEARLSGQGQVIDAAMVDGAAVLSTLFHGLRASGVWNDVPGTNILDSGAHWYEVYETSDGGHIAVGALEPQFYAELLRRMELPPEEFPQLERERWPELKERFAEVFAGRTRAEWVAILEPAETCATAVYGIGEAPEHPHMAARKTFVERDGVVQPAPAPRFSRTSPELADEPPDLDETLARWGVEAAAAADRD